MNTLRHDYQRDPGRGRAGVARADNRPRARYPRGRPLPLVVLLVALGLLPLVATATERQATPGPSQGATPEGVTIDRLGEATLGLLDVPRALDSLALARPCRRGRRRWP